MEINPLAELWVLENAREVSCPGCKKAIREAINPFYHGEALETPTVFVCDSCQLFICGCCGAVYPRGGGESTVRVKLTPFPAWEEEIERFKEYIRAGSGEPGG